MILDMLNIKREWVIFGLGFVVFVLPLLGFPKAVDNFVFLLAGFMLMVSALRVLRIIYRSEREANRVNSNPVQNADKIKV